MKYLFLYCALCFTISGCMEDEKLTRITAQLDQTFQAPPNSHVKLNNEPVAIEVIGFDDYQIRENDNITTIAHIRFNGTRLDLEYSFTCWGIICNPPFALTDTYTLQLSWLNSKLLDANAEGGARYEVTEAAMLFHKVK